MNGRKYWCFSILFFNCYLKSSSISIPKMNVPGCGKLSEVNPSKRSLLVVGGDEVQSVHKWPWMAAIRMKTNNNVTRFLCGGSLITRRHILTAAHCFGRNFLTKSPSDFVVVMGSLNQTYDGDIAEINQIPGVQVLIPSQIKIHPGFQYSKNEDDIAIISLQRNVVTSDEITPICLPEYHQRRLDFGLVSLAGWGGRNQDEEHTETLQEATFSIVPISRCQLLFREVPAFRELITSKMICAGDTRNRKDACKGDSGGPLILYDEEEEKYMQLGVAIFGYNCGEEGYPGLYARTGSYLHWIERSVKRRN